MKQENCKMNFNFTFATSAPLRLINQGLKEFNRKYTKSAKGNGVGNCKMIFNSVFHFFFASSAPLRLNKA